MPDNLTIQIGADSSKMRADLALAERSLRDMRKELKLAADEAAKTGDRTRLDKVSKDFQSTEAEVRKYSRSLRDASRAQDELGTSSVGAAKGITGIVGAFRGVAAAAATAVASVAGVTKAIGSVTENLTELRNISEATGGAFSGQDVKILQEVMEGAGVKTELARQALAKFSVTLSQAQQNAFAPAAKAFDELGINQFRFSNQTDGARRALVEFAQKLNELKGTNPLQAAAVGTEMFGRQWSRIAISITRLAESGALDKINQQLQQTGRAFDPEVKKRLDDYEAAWDRLGDAIESIIQPLVVYWYPALTQGLNNWATALENLKSFFVEQFKEIADVWKGFTELIANALPWQALADAAKASLGQVMDAINAVINGIKWITGNAPPQVVAEAPIPGMAGGGYVSGPGGPTSDSILARLSDGEYVMRARAVERWGPQFMEALNNLRNPFGSFAQGGMVRARSIPSFAGGGLVAGGGATVNLVFPGGSFALQADNAIVGGLTREARRAGMLAGGRRAGLLQ